jgi:hypothetical protein
MELSSKESFITGNYETRVHPLGATGLIAIWSIEQSKLMVTVILGDKTVEPFSFYPFTKNSITCGVASETAISILPELGLAIGEMMSGETRGVTPSDAISE